MLQLVVFAVTFGVPLHETRAPFTTSDFSAEARAYLGKVQHRIVLINGAELARLMIRHGVGVRPRSTYVIKGVDEDYFAEVSGL